MPPLQLPNIFPIGNGSLFPVKPNPPNLLTSARLLVMLNRGNGQVPVGLPVFKIGRRVALRAVVGSTPIHSRDSLVNNFYNIFS